MIRLDGRVIVGLSASLLLVMVLAWRFTTLQSRSTLTASQQALCGSEVDIRRSIAKLASTSPDGKNAADNLTLLAKQSSQCRSLTIEELTRAMNDRPPNNVKDPSAYFLWANGAAVLGDLNAVESLDLLIDHLDLNDGFFSASMAHQPLVPAVGKMGVLAVPKLAIALQRHPNRDIRLAAALCLADIGGMEATEALKTALRTEADQCVRRFVTLSLPTSRQEQDGQRGALDDRDRLRERLIAFRCGN